VYKKEKYQIIIAENGFLLNLGGLTVYKICFVKTTRDQLIFS